MEEPENFTTRQQAKLAWIAKTEPRLHSAYLLKEGLRLIFQLPPEEALDALEAWISGARRSRIEGLRQAPAHHNRLQTPRSSP